MIKKKRGQLGLDEEKFIRDNYGSLTVDQIADRLNRNVDPINRYIKENNIKYTKPNNDVLGSTTYIYRNEKKLYE